MLTLAKGAIKSFVLPAGFVMGEEEQGGMGFNWRREFNRAENDLQVQIMSFYRGQPAAKPDGDAFRSILAQPAQIIFTEGTTDPASAEPVLSELWGALGNAGNNQITNDARGLGGPRFHIELAQTAQVNERSVIIIAGWFHGPDQAVHNYYCGVFFDGNPAEPRSPIEELVLQAATRDLYNQYLPVFHAALRSIEWN